MQNALVHTAQVVAETPDWGIHLASGLAILVMMVLYNVGILSRSVIFPTGVRMPIGRQLAAGIPVGLVTTGFYGKTAIMALDFSSSGMLFDASVIGGNVILLGMLSRETLEKMLKSGSPAMTLPTPGLLQPK